MLKKIGVSLLVVLVIVQFFHPSRNEAAGEQANAISGIYTIPPAVKSILARACMDCHSNNTVYPWYSKIQPVDWWLTHHIEEGKRELNFDEFTTYNLRRQYHKLEEISEEVKNDAMPLDSYTWVHTNARLTASEKNELVKWADSLRAIMKSKYPLDSLERNKN